MTGHADHHVLLVPRGDAEVHRRLTALQRKGGRIHHLDARRLTTEQGVYAAFAEVLQFPGYFGRNWDALVDCLDDLCGAVTGGVGMAAVIHDADLLLEAEHFPLFVSVLCQGADRANATVDLDGFPLDRPAVSQHFVLEFRDFDGDEIARCLAQPDLVVTKAEGRVTAALDPEAWGIVRGL